jgi:arginine decarboxylase
VETIEVVRGTGSGHTPRSALDAGLAAAGVGDYNLVRLSSIVPAGAEVRVVGTHDREWGVGRPVAAVLADAVDDGPVAAGIGWATAVEGGVFMECTADGTAGCRERLVAGVEDARAGRAWDWDEEVRTDVTAHDSDAGKYACAVVAAVYAPLAFATGDRDGRGDG